MWEFNCQPFKTQLLGVLNLTPDSFSDGGRFKNVSSAIKRALLMQGEGADILDVGGESSRPGAKPVSVREEIRRVIPFIRKVLPKLKIPISIDTYKYDVASAALDAGAVIVNDIRALAGNKRLAKKIARYKAGVILMHMQGMPQTMQKMPHYVNVVKEIAFFLKRRTEFALESGIEARRIAIDPGFGFGKSFEHNYEILAGLNYYSRLKFPMVVGLSRKSFIGQGSCLAPEKRLYGTLAASVIAVLNGASLLRVHDVSPHREAVRVANRILISTQAN